MAYFDTHAHYYDERFLEECAGGADEIIKNAFDGGVSYIINVGTCPETSRAAAEQAKRYPNMYTAIGIHPSDARLIDDIDEALALTEALIADKSNKCVALGEIGLDYHYPDTDKDMQKRVFRAQMAMAERLGLPVVIHDRESHADVLEIVREFPSVRGVMHSFSGSAEMAEELVRLGYMISFSGTLTFTNARKPKEAAIRVARDRLLIETDCPYLAPHPLRGTLNHSGNLVYTSRVMAGLIGMDEAECAALTEENARRFFGI